MCLRGDEMTGRGRKLPATSNGLLLPSVQQTLSTLDSKDAKKDAGLRRLTEVYAAAIDEALDMALSAQKLVEEHDDPTNPFEVAKRLLNALVKFSESTAVLEQLGPKLQTALEALGASPKARATMTRKPGGGTKPNDESAKPELTPFEKRRAAAAERAQQAKASGADGPSTVDAPA